MPANSRESMINHHRACRGKAHASGIGKQNSRTVASIPRNSTAKSPVIKKITSPAKNETNGHRKLSRNSTSSWDYSDSDSLNSFDAGQNGDSPKDPSAMIRRIDMVLDDIDRAKSVYRKTSMNRTPDNRRCFKPESWAETLRSGVTDNRFKKLEAGWDDNNIITHPRERKWRLVKDNGYREDSNCNRILENGSKKYYARKMQHGKVCKRTKQQRSFCDVIEWEELLDMAMARKAGKFGKQANGNKANVFLKDLEILLEARVPRSEKVKK